jgi:hypothetical protein
MTLLGVIAAAAITIIAGPAGPSLAQAATKQQGGKKLVPGRKTRAKAVKRREGRPQGEERNTSIEEAERASPTTRPMNPSTDPGSSYR